MQSLSSANVVSILQRTLGHVDARLAGHGQQVAYRVYRMLRMHGGFSDAMLRDMCLIALLHDIGAYRTEEIDQMLRFDTEDVWDHALWGYLFLEHFSPLPALAPAILYHHADIALLDEQPPEVQLLAQCIRIADRADIFALQEEGMASELFPSLAQVRGTHYRGDIIDLFEAANPLPLDPAEIKADAAYQHLMQAVPYTADEVEAYLRMNVLSIDFRSPNTVTHTITTSACSRTLARHLQVPPDAAQAISIGASLHDLGKTGIPLEILEFPGKLSPQAMRIMKTHVEMTEDILTNNVPPDILDIAIRHHEKLDGSGYPHQLTAKDLTPSDRIVAVADIVSALYEVRSYKGAFSKERILTITGKMAEEGLIDADIVRVMTRNFDEVVSCIDGARDPIMEHYDTLQQEFIALQSRLDPR